MGRMSAMKSIRKKVRNKFYLCLLLILSASFLNAQQYVDSKRVIRILSYNIFHGETLNHDFDLERIAAVIRSVSPDIVALQEVDFKTKRAKSMDLVTRLGYLTGMHPLFGRAMKYDGGEYGEGILSRFSFKETRNNPLPHSPRNEPRAALEVLVELPSGDKIVFIGTHLDHTRDQTDRISQAKRLNRLFKKYKKPTILSGDLNATPESEPMKILFRIWTDASDRNPQPTFPSSSPRRRIDYVLFRPADRWRVMETRVIEEKVASDHCPLLVVLELLAEKRK
jgi:endonuclease/exonuclease/phosphatase family metal-dependent hydrolase